MGRSLPVTLLFAIAMLPVSARTEAPTPMKVRTDKLDYRDGDTILEGYLAYPDVAGKRPGVVVVHEWMGPGEHVRDSARKLAALGYVALAVDIYGKDLRPNNPEEAGKAAGQFRGGDRKNLRARMQLGLDALIGTGRVDKNKLAAIGYCFGGTAVLELARTGADLAGVATFHGGLSRGTGPSAKIKTKLLVLHGADDPFVNAAEVAGFEQEMKAAGVDMRFVAYPGAVHSFTNPAAGNDNSRGAAYNAEAAAKAWREMTAFFATVLGS